MQINRRSWIVRVAYFLEEERIPSRVSLCALFWRCAALAVLKGVFVAVMALPAGAVFLCEAAAEKRRQRRRALAESGGELPRAWRERWQDSTAYELIDSFKRRVCPLIQINS